jgi:hypothetical protein
VFARIVAAPETLLHQLCVLAYEHRTHSNDHNTGWVHPHRPVCALLHSRLTCLFFFLPIGTTSGLRKASTEVSSAAADRYYKTSQWVTWRPHALIKPGRGLHHGTQHILLASYRQSMTKPISFYSAKMYSRTGCLTTDFHLDSWSSHGGRQITMRRFLAFCTL